MEHPTDPTFMDGRLPRPDPWQGLKSHTDARIALGRTGTSLPTQAVLGFQLDHARAKDAVTRNCCFDALESWLMQENLMPVHARSQARDRQEYLKRPDLGRLPDKDSLARLAGQHSPSITGKPGLPRLLILAGDGLSSLAVETQARPFLEAFLFGGTAWPFCLLPVVLASQARVALADGIGEALGADATMMLIGERPGLSSPDSLGLYLTWKPRKGLQNGDRNCISNIRPGGLAPELAAGQAMDLVRTMFLQRVSGVRLKPEGLPGA